tara:strand:+ start:2577 stop:3095 length:519 start_codon:yes stop_codon:yes gene_type:complete
MPIFEFRCENRHLVEELFFQNENVPDLIECPICRSDSQRRKVGRISILGMDSLQMEEFNRAHFNTQELRNGMGVSSNKEAKLLEESRGLRRVDPNSSTAKQMKSDQLDEHYTNQRVRKESGIGAMFDNILKRDIQAKHGWSDSRFSTWKENQDGAANTYDAKRDVVDPGSGA